MKLKSTRSFFGKINLKLELEYEFLNRLNKSIYIYNVLQRRIYKMVDKIPWNLTFCPPPIFTFFHLI